MPKKYTINVTQAHIDEAIRRNKKDPFNVCRNCPIAVAAREQIDPRIRVTRVDMYIPQTNESYNLPTIGKNIAQTMVTVWNTLQPTSFEVESNE